VDTRVGIPALYPKLIVQRLADDLEDRFLCRSRSPVGVFRDLPSQQLRFLDQRVMRNDFCDHVALQRPMRVDRFGSKNQLHRYTDTADVDQPCDSAVTVMEPAPPLAGSAR